MKYITLLVASLLVFSVVFNAPKAVGQPALVYKHWAGPVDEGRTHMSEPRGADVKLHSRYTMKNVRIYIDTLLHIFFIFYILYFIFYNFSVHSHIQSGSSW